MNNKEKKIKNCIKLIKLAFNINMEAHKYSELSQECYNNWDHEWAADYSSEKQYFYNKKSSLIEKIIKYIKKYSLPIKYGMNDWVVYFAYNWEQVSFHTFRSEKKYVYNTLKFSCKSKIKTYNWNWKWTKNFIFPEKLNILI